LEIDVIDGRAFAGHAVMTHGVWTVGADLHFENRLSIHLADRLHRDASEGEVVGKLAIVDLEVNDFAEPLWRKSHSIALSSQHSAFSRLNIPVQVNFSGQ